MRFCEHCRKDVPYVIKDETLTATIRGRIYTYNGKVAYCTECGNQIWTAETQDANLKALKRERKRCE
ncbi:MAG: hypothetical protein HDQ88_05135 [Clostridia bacterium]|nr:hypothetical protein [Clostridia bacterium]